MMARYREAFAVTPVVSRPPYYIGQGTIRLNEIEICSRYVFERMAQVAYDCDALEEYFWQYHC